MAFVCQGSDTLRRILLWIISPFMGSVSVKGGCEPDGFNHPVSFGTTDRPFRHVIKVSVFPFVELDDETGRDHGYVLERVAWDME